MFFFHFHFHRPLMSPDPSIFRSLLKIQTLQLVSVFVFQFFIKCKGTFSKTQSNPVLSQLKRAVECFRQRKKRLSKKSESWWTKWKENGTLYRCRTSSGIMQPRMPHGCSSVSMNPSVNIIMQNRSEILNQRKNFFGGRRLFGNNK